MDFEYLSTEKKKKSLATKFHFLCAFTGLGSGTDVTCCVCNYVMSVVTSHFLYTEWILFNEM